MKTTRHNLGALVVTLTFSMGILLGGCKGDDTSKELEIAAANYPFEIVEDAADINADFVLVFGIQGSEAGSKEELMKYAVSHVTDVEVDALILGNENRGPDMGDCIPAITWEIPAGTFYGVKYLTEQDREQHRQWCNKGVIESSM